MTLLRKLASLGGWWANQLNQNVFFNSDDSKSTRPENLAYVLLIIAFLFIAGLVLLVVNLAGGGPAEGRDPVNLLGPAIIELLIGLFGLLLVVGWRVNLVAFVTDRNQSSVDGPLPKEYEIETHVTGVVGTGHNRRRFRHRAAVIRAEGQDLHLDVHGIRTRNRRGTLRRVTASHLMAGSVTDVVRGSAQFVTATRPALRFGWRNGPVMLDFNDESTRERALTALRRVGS